MADNLDKNVQKMGFPAAQVQGFPAPSKGFPAPATGFPAIGGFASSGFPSLQAEDIEEDVDNVTAVDDGEPKAGTVPKNVRFFEGVNRLNKTETKYAWEEFGGERLATYEEDGSGFITRIIERASKKTGVYFKLTERLIKDAEGYGSIEWRIELGAVVRRKPPKQEFQTAWGDDILASVRKVVAEGANVSTAARELAEALDVSFSTMRANLWVADKWSRGETTTFLPHRSMIRPIFELMCELGKKQETLQALIGYSKSVKKPSTFVVEILKENGVM